MELINLVVALAVIGLATYFVRHGDSAAGFRHVHSRPGGPSATPKRRVRNGRLRDNNRLPLAGRDVARPARTQRGSSSSSCLSGSRRDVELGGLKR